MSIVDDDGVDVVVAVVDDDVLAGTLVCDSTLAVPPLLVPVAVFVFP